MEMGGKKAPRETEDNSYAKFWGDKPRALWYVMVFLESSIEMFLQSKQVKRTLQDSIHELII